MNYLKGAVRQLLRRPAVSIVVVTVLAIGIGVTTGIFSLFHQVLIQPLPVPEPDRLVSLSSPGPIAGPRTVSMAGDSEHVFSYPMFRDLEEQQSVFAGLAAYRDFEAGVAEERVTVAGNGVMVSGSYFDVLGLRPAVGRLIGPEDEPKVGESAVVVLSYDYWQTRFGGDPNVVGTGLTVNGQRLTVIGVAPEGFRGKIFGHQPRVFVPITLRWLMEPWRAHDEANRRSYWVYLFARLAPGISVERAAEGISGLYGGIINDVEAPLNSSMADDVLQQFRNKRISLEPGGTVQGLLANAVARPLTLLFALTAVVLVVVCVNIANLLLAQGLSRTAETAIRVTMGATWWQLLTQSLVDAVLPAVIGGIAGLPIALATLRVIGALLPEMYASGLDMELSRAALSFAATASLVTALIFGAAPAVQAARTDPGLTVKGTAFQTPGGRRMLRTRNALATTQIAFSTVLLVLAGLFAQSLMRITHIDLGLGLNSIVTFTVSPRRVGQDPERTMASFDRIEERLAMEPGVDGVGASRIALLARRGWTSPASSFRGFDQAPAVDRSVAINAVSTGYLTTLSIPLLRGRDFSESDTLASPAVAVVNESFVRLYGLGDAALGARFDIGSRENIEIVGVAADTKYSGVTDEIPPTVLLPWRQQENLDGLTFYVRGSGTDALMRMIPRVISEIDSSLPVTDLRTMNRQAQDDIFLERLIATLSASFAGLATFLAGIGLYGVLAYNVTQRTRELGLRQALGASPADLRALVLKQVALLAVIGVAVGLGAAVGAGRMVEALLFGLSGYDPVVLVATAITVSVVVLAASYFPARRAAKIAPFEALRYQ